jgi:hypothetical protein
MQRRRRNSEINVKKVLAAIVRDLQAEGKTGLVKWLYISSNMGWAGTQVLAAIEAETGESASLGIGPVGLGRVLETRRMTMKDAISVVKSQSVSAPFGGNGALAKIRGVEGESYLYPGMDENNIFFVRPEAFLPDNPRASSPAGVVAQRKSGKFSVSFFVPGMGVAQEVPRKGFDSIADAIRHINDNAEGFEVVDDDDDEIDFDLFVRKYFEGLKSVKHPHPKLAPVSVKVETDEDGEKAVVGRFQQLSDEEYQKIPVTKVNKWRDDISRVKSSMYRLPGGFDITFEYLPGE